jgi:hypothetical protein
LKFTSRDSAAIDPKFGAARQGVTCLELVMLESRSLATWLARLARAIDCVSTREDGKLKPDHNMSTSR